MKCSLIVTGLALFIFMLFFGTALFQERNSLPVFSAVLRLELSGIEIAPISSNSNLLIQKVGEGEAPLTEYLSENGWEFIDRLGSAIFYEKDGATLTVSSRMFSRRYIIYELEVN